MKVKCITNIPIDKNACEYAVLTRNNIYRVLEMSPYYYLLICDTGKPYLFDTRRFEVVDPEIESNWIPCDCGSAKTEDKDGLCYFVEEFDNHLIEQYHDVKPDAIQKFNEYILRLFRETVGSLEGIQVHPYFKNKNSNAQDLF